MAEYTNNPSNKSILDARDAAVGLSQDDAAHHPKNNSNSLSITVCRTLEKVAARKKVAFLADGSVQSIADYPKGLLKWTREVHKIPVDIDAFGVFIEQTAEEADAILVTGEPVGEFSLDTPVRRLKQEQDNGDQPTLKEYAAPWLPLDFDDIPIEWALDPLDPGAAIAEVVEMLGPPFCDASYVWALTSRACPGARSVRARVFFLIDRPISNEERNAWGKGFNAKTGRKLVDCALFTANQAIYTAHPEIKGRDPFPRRCGVTHGLHELVPWDQVQIETAEKSAYQGDYPRSVHRSIGERLQAIGDGPGGEGCHGPIRDAVLSMVRYKWLPEAIIAAIRERVAEAEWNASHSQSYVRAETTERVLKASIRGAVRLLKVQENTPRAKQTRKIQDVLPLPEAEKAVSAAIRSWFEEEDDAAVFVVKATVGLGKTHAAVEIAREKLSGNLSTLLWAAPNHHQAEQVLGAFNAPWPEKERCQDEDDDLFDLEGIFTQPAAIKIEGRVPSESRDSAPLCSRPHLINQIKKAGRAAQTNKIACEREGIRCPHFSSCGYMSQFFGPERIRIFPHAYLPLPKSRVMARRFVDRSLGLIIDESPVQTLIDRLRFYELDAVLAKGGLLAKALTALKEGATLDPETWSAGLTKEMEARCPFPDTIFTPDAKDESLLMGELRDMEGADGGLYVLYAQVIRVIEGDHGLIWFRKNGQIDQVLCARRFNLPEMKTLILDATADEETYRAIFGDRLRFFEVHAEQNLEIIQAMDTPGGKSKLVGANDDLLVRGCALARMQDAVVISNLEAIAKAKERGYLDKDHPVAHFNALRGSNSLETATTAVIMGRPEPDALTLEAMGRALFPTEQLVLTGKLEWRQDGLTNVACHADRRLDALLRGIREAEITQAIGRLRAVRSSVTKRVFVITHTPVESVSRQLPLDQILPHANLARAFIKFGGVIPLVPQLLARVLPEIWSSPKAAEDWLRRDLKPAFSLNRYLYKEIAGFKSETPHPELPDPERHSGGANSFPHTYRFRVAGQRQWSKVLTWVDGWECQSNLELTLGQTLVAFERVEEDTPPAITSPAPALEAHPTHPSACSVPTFSVSDDAPKSPPVLRSVDPPIPTEPIELSLSVSGDYG